MKNDLSENEISLFKAVLVFAHLNRGDFYRYLEEHGHNHLITLMEESDVNKLRIKFGNIHDHSTKP